MTAPTLTDTEYRELCAALRKLAAATMKGFPQNTANGGAAAIESLQAEVVRLSGELTIARATQRGPLQHHIDSLRDENAELREHANALAVDIETHDHECQRLCGEGDQEALGCGYRPYFEFSGRRCPHCPIHNKLDGMALAAYRAWLERKP